MDPLPPYPQKLRPQAVRQEASVCYTIFARPVPTQGVCIRMYGISEKNRCSTISSAESPLVPYYLHLAPTPEVTPSLLDTSPRMHSLPATN